jgi:hypothetical protein
MTHPVGKRHQNRSNAHRRQREVAIGMLASGGRHGQLSAAMAFEEKNIRERGFFASVMANVAAMSRAVRFPRKTGAK